MNKEQKQPDHRVPVYAAWLGALGLIPFVAFTVASLITNGLPGTEMHFALIAYGAVILSFLGGIHWGLIIASDDSVEDVSSRRALVIGVLPAVVGWVALIPATSTGLMILIAGFILMLWVDSRAAVAGSAPRWYPRLRWPLTIVVLISLTGAWML